MVAPPGPRIAPAEQEDLLPASFGGASEGAAVDELYRALYILRKRKWVVALFAIATVIGVVAYTLRQPMIYRAAATLGIDRAAPKVRSSIKDVREGGGRGGYMMQREYMETQ